MNSDKHSFYRQTIENLKLRRMEELGEVYDVDKSAIEDASCSTADNLKAIVSYEQHKHNREASKSALTYWRNEEAHFETNTSEHDALPKQNQNLDSPGMGLDMSCFTSFVAEAHKNVLLSSFRKQKNDSTSH